MTTSFGSSRPSTPSLHGKQQHESDFNVGHLVVRAVSAAMQVLAFPFDAIRAQYVIAVRAGLIQRSMLAQRDFERVLDAVERFSLGPWARRV